MDNLERIFKQHEEMFNQEEPSQEHLTNFLDKLNKEKKKERFFVLPLFLKVAAIAIFVALSGVFGYRLHVYKINKYGLGGISPEYNEVELYYTSNINTQIKLIENLEVYQPGQEHELLCKELQNMDKLYQQLKKEMMANPGDERLIQAMIKYYQAKSNILNKIIEQLYQVKQQKANNYETTQI